MWCHVHICSCDDFLPGDSQAFTWTTGWTIMDMSFVTHTYIGCFCHESLIEVKLNTLFSQCHWASLSSLSTFIHDVVCWITRISPHRRIKIMNVFLIQCIVCIRSTITSSQSHHIYYADYISISYWYMNISNTFLHWKFNRRQTIIWTNDGLVYWHMYASLGLDELSPGSQRKPWCFYSLFAFFYI